MKATYGTSILIFLGPYTFTWLANPLIETKIDVGIILHIKGPAVVSLQLPNLGHVISNDTFILIQ